MQQNASHLPPLDGVRPATGYKPCPWFVLTAFSAGILTTQAMAPRITPPGWPSEIDFFSMLLIPIGGIAMAWTTLPGWIIGMYGALAMCVILPGQLHDTRLKMGWAREGAVEGMLQGWCAAILVAWAFCRACALLRAASGHIGLRSGGTG